MEGLAKILSLKASLNNGLTTELNQAFPNIIPVERSQVQLNGTPGPNWLAGFTDGEGCFGLEISKGTTKTGFAVALRISISQKSRDMLLLKSFINKFGCGSLKTVPNTGMSIFSCSKLVDINNYIIPFFNQYPLHGTKILDYLDFCRAAELINAKAHLTSDGLDKLRLLQAGMNRGRK
jgi:hypothetical protein